MIRIIYVMRLIIEMTCKIIGLFFIMIPTIIIGTIKNKKYIAEHPDAEKIEDSERIDDVIPEARR